MTSPERKPDHVGGSPPLTDSSAFSFFFPRAPPRFYLIIGAVITRWLTEMAPAHRTSFYESLCLLSPPLFSPQLFIIFTIASSCGEIPPSHPLDLWLKKIKDNPVREHVDLSLSSFSTLFSPLCFLDLQIRFFYALSLLSLISYYL